MLKLWRIQQLLTNDHFSSIALCKREYCLGCDIFPPGCFRPYQTKYLSSDEEQWLEQGDQGRTVQEPTVTPASVGRGGDSHSSCCLAGGQQPKARCWGRAPGTDRDVCWAHGQQQSPGLALGPRVRAWTGRVFVQDKDGGPGEAAQHTHSAWGPGMLNISVVFTELFLSQSSLANLKQLKCVGISRID